MAKVKVKVRFRRIWTVYLDMKLRGNVVSESFTTEELAWKYVRVALRNWVQTDPSLDAELRKELLSLLAKDEVEATREARDVYADQLDGIDANRIWIEETRLVSSRE